ncbi:hypothetical protein JCM10449v2_005680 [Rhodotorula kratochvilovae]
MSSSSELEVLPAVRKPASPPKPRRSGRDRRAPRGVDELAAPAAEKARRRAELDLESTDAETAHSEREGDEDDASPLPEAMKPLPARAAAQSAPVASTSSVQLPTPFHSVLLPAPVPAALSTSTSSPAPRPALAPPQPKSKPQPSLRRSHTPADPAPRPAPAPAPRAKPPPQTSYSSDEADDFFGARKPAPPKGRAPKAAGGGAARVGRLPSRASSGSATPRPTSPAKRARPQAIDLSSSTSDSDSSTAPRRGGGALSSSDDDDGPGSKLKLPEWALTGRGAAVSGADRQRAANGAGRNRKRKRLGESGSEAEGAGAHEGGAEGKGKGRAKDDDAELLELSGDETDDSLELALAGGSKADQPRASSPMQKKKKRAVASSSPTPPPPRKMASPRKRPHGDRLPAVGLAPPPLPSPLRSPRRALPASSSPQKDTQASHLTLSSNSDEPDYAHYGAFEDEPPLDDTLAAIRSRLALARSAHAPAAGGSSPEKTGAAGEEDGGKVTIRLQMVFDPTRSVPEVAKRAYEKEEVFEHGLHEPFAALFYGLSVRRTIPRDDLVITHVRSSSTSGAGGKPTQLYEFGTPASLSLSAGEEAHMRGYTADVWAKVRASAAAPPPEDDEDAELERAAAAAAKAARGSVGALVLDDDDDDDDDDAESGEQEREQGFPLTLRGSRTQSLSLAVKPSTSMSQLIKAYCRHFAIADAARQGRMWVEFDGDRLEGAMTLQEAKDEFDLEGEETFEVKEPA